MAKDERQKRSEKDASNHPPGLTAMRKMTCLCWKVPKMEKIMSLSLVYGISKKTDLNSWFCSLFSIFVTFIVIFWPLWASWGAYWGPLGPLALLWGPLRAPMNGLTSIVILIPGLVQPPVQLGKFVDFWSLPKQQCQSQSWWRMAPEHKWISQ